MILRSHFGQGEMLNADAISRTTHNSYVMQCDAGENVKLEELKRAQVADSWGKSILQYLVHGLLPNDAIEAKKVAAESNKYVLNDGVLYYVWSQTQSRGDAVYSKIHETPDFRGLP